MKTTFYTGILIFILFNPISFFCQVAPSLGGVASFAVFTGTGAINNTGLTNIDGSVGSNAGAYTGIAPIITNGQLHIADSVSNQASIDLNIAYSNLAAMTPDTTIGNTLGSGQILTPHIYNLNAASVLNGDLTLDAKGNPNAVFIFKINGAFSVSDSSHIILLNSASLCNIYWQINGAFELGSLSVFKGTMIANGAINLLANSSLIGHCFSRIGAISLNSNQINIGINNTIITPMGPTTFLLGDSVILSANVNTSYMWSTLATTQNITAYTSGNYSVMVTNTNGCTGSFSINILVENYLPIVLLSFSAEVKSNLIQLNWSTASETNTDNFDIERSSDGINFERINSTKAAGNSTQKNDYEVKDDAPLQGISYYRIKQTDLDKHIEYSFIISVEMFKELDFDVQVFPNPITSGYCNVYIKSEDEQFISIVFKNLFGKELYSKNVLSEYSNHNFLVIDDIILDKGVYIMTISLKDKTSSKKIIIH